MRLATEKKEGTQPTQAARGDRSAEKLHTQPHHENSSHPSKDGLAESQEHSAILARATNDAVRDWNVITGELTWPQGLESLLGYCRSNATDQIGFWQKQIHPEDRARAATSIRDALAGRSENWSGEYRFQRVDGSYAHLLVEESLHPHDRRDPDMFFLPKPFDPEQLARKIRETLDSTNGTR